MKANTMLIIERVGNGYLVRPFGPAHVVADSLETMVFQHKGQVTPGAATSLQETLFGWLDDHFSSADGK